MELPKLMSELIEAHGFWPRFWHVWTVGDRVGIRRDDRRVVCPPRSNERMSDLEVSVAIQPALDEDREAIQQAVVDELKRLGYSLVPEIRHFVRSGGERLELTGTRRTIVCDADGSVAMPATASAYFIERFAKDKLKEAYRGLGEDGRLPVVDDREVQEMRTIQAPRAQVQKSDGDGSSVA